MSNFALSPMIGSDPRSEVEMRMAGDVAPLAPCNEEIEAALLGALLRNNRAYDAVSDFLLPEHF